MVQAFVTTSRIYYYNCIFNDISYYNICGIQRIQNVAAPSVTNTRKYDHIIPIIQKLHWLPVRQRLHFKRLLTTRKSSRNLMAIQSESIAGIQCLSSSHMEIVRLVSHLPFCGIGCRQILQMCLLLKFCNLF